MIVTVIRYTADVIHSSVFQSCLHCVIVTVIRYTADVIHSCVFNPVHTV